MHRKRVISLPFDRWPAPDQASWHQLVRDGGLFDEAGPVAHWAPTTQRSVQNDYGVWLHWCADRQTLDSLSPDERVTPTSIAQYVADLNSRVSPVTTFMYVKRLHRVIILQHPSTDWKWLTVLTRQLARLATPATAKAARVQDSTALVALGFTLMEAAPDPSNLALKREKLAAAVLYRDGLMIALLATRPLRRKNFAAIRLDQHLSKIDGTWWLQFAAQETKQRQPIEQVLPALLQAPLETYLTQYRGLFPGAETHDFLWASAKGVPLTDKGMYQRIIKRTTQAFAAPINPHLFRDCAATTIARHRPKHVGIASQILGHTGLVTTERHYNQAGSVTASEDYHAALEEIRGETKR